MSESLTAQLAARLAPNGVSELEPMSGGASSLTYAGRLGGQRVVVKVAPPGVAPTLNRDVLRQSRVLRALHESPVPVPDVLWEDPGEPPDVPPLFVMAHLDGSSFEPLFDADHRAGPPDPDSAVAERFRAAAAVLARLHDTAPDALGLAGEPVVGPAEEVERWCRTLDTVDPTLAPGWGDVADALRSTVPAALPATLVHGDFRLGNLLASGARITAVIDWEIWSIGDPRVDAGWFLINSDPHTYRRATPHAGRTPAPDELASIYRARLGREVPDLAWFNALACFKSAATWSLIVKHNRRHRRPKSELEAMVPVLPELLAQASRLLS